MFIYKKLSYKLLQWALTIWMGCTQVPSDSKEIIKVSRALQTSPATLKTAVIGGIGTGYIRLDSRGEIGPIENGPDIEQESLQQIPACFAAVWMNQQGMHSALALSLNNHYSLPAVSKIEFTPLFPSALFSYPDRSLPLKISQKMFCPILPGDIRNSTLNGVISIFHVENHSQNLVQCSVALSWASPFQTQVTNSAGSTEHSRGQKVSTIPASEGLFGLRILSNSETASNKNPGGALSAPFELALLAMPSQSSAVVTTAGWNALQQSPAWWTEFSAQGTVSGPDLAADPGKSEPAAVISVKLKIQPRGSVDIPFAVVWKIPPVIAKTQTALNDANIIELGRKLLMDFQSLSGLTEEWQKKILFSNLPSPAARAVINSASILTEITPDNSPLPFQSISGQTELQTARSISSDVNRIKNLHRLKLTLFPQQEGSYLLKLWKFDPDKPASITTSPSMNPISVEQLVRTENAVEALASYTLYTGDISILPQMLPFLRTHLTHLFQTDEKNLLPLINSKLSQSAAQSWIDLLSHSKKLMEIGTRPISLANDRAHNINSLLNSVDTISEANLNKRFADRLAIRISESRKQFSGLTSETTSEKQAAAVANDILDWNWMERLGGFTINRVEGEISIKPDLPGSWRRLSIPIFSPTFWGHLQYKPLAGGAVYNLRIDRLIPLSAADPNWNSELDAGLNFRKIIVGSLPSPDTAADVKSPSVHVSLRQNPLGVTAHAMTDGSIELIFDAVVNMAAGDNLQVEVHR